MPRLRRCRQALSSLRLAHCPVVDRLFGAACLATYAGAGYYAGAPSAAPESIYRHLCVVGVGHAKDSYGSGAHGWDASTLKALRRRDFPPLNHPEITPGRGKNAHAERLALALDATVFEHVEQKLLGLASPTRRALLGASYSACLALQTLLIAPTSIDAYILGSPSVPFDPELLAWLSEAPIVKQSACAPGAFIAYGALEREPELESELESQPAGTTQRRTTKLANVHFGIPAGSHDLASTLRERGVMVDGAHEVEGEDHTSLKLTLVSRGLAWLVNSRWCATTIGEPAVPPRTHRAGKDVDEEEEAGAAKRQRCGT